ncbi:PAS domain-containing protein, partial [Patescibacteria group bacterium]|nr:PAS domain-containing protein [Patescibacteria group bacterium]
MSKLPKYATPEIKFTKRPLPKVEIKKKPSLKKSQLQFKKRGINRSEHWYKAMVENMQNSVWVSDEGIKVFYVNPSLCKLLGYSAEEIIGKSEYDFWSKETAEKVKRVVATDRKEGISSSYEGELVTKSGEKIPVLVLGTPLPGGGTVGILTDLRNVKKNEKALADSEKKYRAIFENTGTATVIIEEDFTISLVNSEFEYISGCSRAQLEGKKEWTEFFVKEDVKKMMRYHRLRRTANGGVPRNYEARFIDSKGNVRNTFLTVSMIPGTKKSVASILDITEHIQLEKELTQRESELSLITKSSLDVIFILTKNGKVAYASPASKEMLGFKPEEIVGASLAKFVSAKDLKKCWKALKDVFRNKKITNLQIDIKDRNGSFTPVEISGQLIEKDGEFCAQGTMRNIQKRKEAEMALKESEEKYRSMIDQSMVGICMLQGTKLIFANKKLANIFGRSNADELIGKDVKKCLTEDSFNLVKKVISAMYRNEKVPELGEYVGIKKNGKQINLQTFSKRIEIQGKIYVQVFVIDATEKKIMETKLAERIKEINVLYRVYSHIKMAQPLAHTLSYITRDIIHAFQFMDVVQARIVFDGKTYTSSKKKENFVHKIEKPIIVAGVKRGILQVGYLKSLPAMEKVPFWPEERKLVETTSQILGKHIRSRE